MFLFCLLICVIIFAFMLYGPVRYNLHKNNFFDENRSEKCNYKTILRTFFSESRKAILEMSINELAALIFSSALIVLVVLCPILNVMAFIAIFIAMIKDETVGSLINMFRWRQR